MRKSVRTHRNTPAPQPGFAWLLEPQVRLRTWLAAALPLAALILTSFQAEVAGFTGELGGDAASSCDPAAGWDVLYCHHVRLKASRQAGGVFLVL